MKYLKYLMMESEQVLRPEPLLIMIIITMMMALVDSILAPIQSYESRESRL